MVPFGVKKIVHVQSRRKTKSRLHQFGATARPGRFIGYAQKCVHVKRFKFTAPRIEKLQEVFRFHCADGSLRRWFPKQEGHLLGSAKGHPSPRPQKRVLLPRRSSQLSGGVRFDVVRDSLNEEGGVADVAEADRDVMEAREYFWSISGDFTYLRMFSKS